MKTLAAALQPIQNMNIVRHLFANDKDFPNNGLLPLLLYHQAFPSLREQDADIVREILETNSWKDSWVDGVYDYHHYHSTAHEALIALKGSARIQFGGPGGLTLPFERGDVVIIPAGVAHKRIEEADGFSCLGAYPQGQEYDMNYGKPGERPKADENIKKVPLPENDPLYGSDGPLVKNWYPEKESGRSSL